MERVSFILLFSGKRKSGKDYFTNRLAELLKDKQVVIKISAPIKEHFAKEQNLDFFNLMSDGEYKEKYRKEMILWSDRKREEDPGIFCRTAIEQSDKKNKEIWIVSDVRRKTDIKWFRENYREKVKIIRLTTSDDIRKDRGWIFTPGIDNVMSECDLDDFTDWDLILDNNGDKKQFDDGINQVLKLINVVL